MIDEDKTKEQLIEELNALRQRVAELEEAVIEGKYAKEEWSVVFDALNSSINGVMITNLEGRITYVNPAFLKMFEYGEKSEVIGRDAADLFVLEKITEFKDVKTAIDSAKGKTEEFAMRRKDGTTFLVEASSSNVTDANTNPIGRMASFVDISEHQCARDVPRRSKTTDAGL